MEAKVFSSGDKTMHLTEFLWCSATKMLATEKACHHGWSEFLETLGRIVWQRESVRVQTEGLINRFEERSQKSERGMLK